MGVAEKILLNPFNFINPTSITMSNLAQQRIREAKEKKLTRLDISNCDLTEIPEEVFELTWLEELNLSGMKYLTYDGTTKFDEYHKDNKIKVIPTEIRKLEKLKRFNINSSLVKDIGPLRTLTGLHVLDISRTHIKNLNPLKNLTQLLNLNVSGIKVTNFACLQYLTKLSQLNISYTNIVDLNSLKAAIRKVTKINCLCIKK